MGKHKEQTEKKMKMMMKQDFKLTDLKRMGTELLSSQKYVNNLPTLITVLKPSSPPNHVLESLISLQSFFTPLLPSINKTIKRDNGNGGTGGVGDEADTDFIYKSWLRSKFDDFVKALIDVFVVAGSESDEESVVIRGVVMDTIMEFVKFGGGGIGGGNLFNSSLYHSFINSVVLRMKDGNGDDSMLHAFGSKYFDYMDVRYFTYISIHKIATTLHTNAISTDGTDAPDSDTSSKDLSIKNTLYILLHIPPPDASTTKEPDHSPMWTASSDSTSNEAEQKHLKLDKYNNDVLFATKMAKKMKLKFTKAWVSFLRLPLPVEVYKEVLVSLDQAVIPYMSNPIMLCDFLTRSYDIGGVISVMALSGLYVLMTKHGLEYPKFYEKLYALLVPSVFIAKHRAKFFELLDSSLKSPLLPAYLAASFAKKLSRLSLSAPPSGGLIIIALIHNLLRRHPSINFLVHREDAEINSNASDVSEGGAKPCVTVGIDHFNNEESDPLRTNALRSSLWEIDSLRHHYCPPVSRFVLSLENDLTVRSKTTEVAVKDFSGGSYATIFGEEIRRRVKQVPLAFYKATPTSLFSEADFPGWSFKHEDDDNVTAKRQRVECA